MVNNKRAKQTLSLPSCWDQYRAINKRLNNNVVVSLSPLSGLDVFIKVSKYVFMTGNETVLQKV